MVTLTGNKAAEYQPATARLSDVLQETSMTTCRAVTRPATRPLQPAPANGFAVWDERVDVSDFLPALAGLSKNIIFVKNESYQFVYANQALLDLYPPEMRGHIMGTTTVENWAEAEARVFLAEDRKAFDEGYAELIEQIKDYTGKTLHIRTQKTRFENSHGERFIMGVCADISPWVAREKEMAKATLALENFAAIAAHDLRSPLGAMISGLDLLQLDDASTISDESLQVISMMRHTAEGLMAQIATLLSTYKTTQTAMAMGPVDFSALVAEVKFNLASLLQDTGGRILTNSIPVVRAERHLLRQVIHNLVENSLKYRSTEAPVIIIRHTDLDNHHLFTVDDNGIGIKAEDAETSFELYEQPKTAIDGFGIGLTLCKKIVSSHGGEIWIEPNVEGGCRVCFTIAKQI